MARAKKANSVDDAAVVELTATADDISMEENMVVNTENEDVVEVEKLVSKQAKNVVKPLEPSEEICVVSLVPNVKYKDGYTNDYYEWDEVGQEEYLTVETLERMWRNSKGYFRNMWLKPEDERVIKKFGLTGVYDSYNFLMDESNYTNDNLDEVYKKLSSATKELKFSLCNKIKSMVATGQLTDIRVIKKLESHLQIDLTSFI